MTPPTHHPELEESRLGLEEAAVKDALGDGGRDVLADGDSADELCNEREAAKGKRDTGEVRWWWDAGSEVVWGGTCVWGRMRCFGASRS